MAVSAKAAPATASPMKNFRMLSSYLMELLYWNGQFSEVSGAGST